MTIKFSKASKMPCLSWSLQALETCPGSLDKKGKLVPACETCYATVGNYVFANVKKPRLHNREDWKRDDWVDDMVNGLAKSDYFRWFDSGDMYHYQLAEKILLVMQLTPRVKHWLPTRMHKFKKFANVIKRMQALENVVVRFSSDAVDGRTIDGDTTSTIIPALKIDKKTVPQLEYMPENAALCEAYTRDGKCVDCRACWDKSVAVVAYAAHGAKAVKASKDIIARSA